MEDDNFILVETVSFNLFDYKQLVPILIHENQIMETPKVAWAPQEIAITFHKFVLQQEKWIQDLLLYTNLEEGITIVQILLEHDAADGLLVVSDGSVRYHNMVFGWVLSDLKTQKILATGSCPGYGKGCSLQAETYGMLAVITYVRLICKFLQRIDPV